MAQKRCFSKIKLIYLERSNLAGIVFETQEFYSDNVETFQKSIRFYRKNKNRKNFSHSKHAISAYACMHLVEAITIFFSFNRNVQQLLLHPICYLEG